MLFNSFEFIFIFLPLTLGGYFLCQKFNMPKVARVYLVSASFFFYSWWNPGYFPLLLASIVYNFCWGRILTGCIMAPAYRKFFLVTGIAANLGLLGFYKYGDFLLANINWLFSADFSYLNLLLPLGISFFTFQQIAYLVDCYKQQAPRYRFFPYALFVSFFPQLIAGPIVHHSEMLQQFEEPKNRRMASNNLSVGLYILVLGLFKKVILADNFAQWASFGFNAPAQLGMVEGWLVSLAYTLQLYFDFSGYSDMAMGAALLFNIKLPANFNSPYKATDIQDFWRRWHMTLGRFLRNYLYIPLGGNRGSAAFVYRNLMITFVLGGLWHGASWTFVFWGFLHGLALVVHRRWQKSAWHMPKWLAVFLTFNFVNLAWVFFRAPGFNDALQIIGAMFGRNGFGFALNGGVSHLPDASLAVIWVLCGIMVCWFTKNSLEKRDRFKPGPVTAVSTIVMFLLAVVNLLEVSEFLYFNF